MPELPEVERVRLSLLPLIGRRVKEVVVRRAGVVERCEHETGANQKSKGPKRDTLATALLNGHRIVELLRHGKQLAIVGGASSASTSASVPMCAQQGASAPSLDAPYDASQGHPQDDRRCLCVHLGMTGSLVHSARSNEDSRSAANAPHAHVVWHLDDDTQLVFDDPRRFGGVWTFASLDQLISARWSRIGPDALAIAPDDLHARLQQTTRGLKATLLDQSVVAGLGNIYVDELLFACGLHPRCPARRLPMNSVRPLVEQMKKLLQAAIEAGGSSLRDYVDGLGQPGDFQHRHQVYGRGGQPCVRCGGRLRSAVIGGRTTVFCQTCQPMRLPTKPRAWQEV